MGGKRGNDGAALIEKAGGAKSFVRSKDEFNWIPGRGVDENRFVELRSLIQRGYCVVILLVSPPLVRLRVIRLCSCDNPIWRASS